MSKIFSHCSTSLLLVLLSHFFHPFMDEKVDFAKSGVCIPGTWAPEFPRILVALVASGTGLYLSLKNSGFFGGYVFQIFFWINYIYDTDIVCMSLGYLGPDGLNFPEASQAPFRGFFNHPRPSRVANSREEQCSSR